MYPAASTAALDSGSPARHAARKGADRRRKRSGISRYSFFGGRRCAARRKEEAYGYIADQHGVVLFLTVAAIAVLNILDAFYTMLFLSHGATELNPFVDGLLQLGGVWPFVIVKSVGIGVCVGFLTLTKNFWASRIGLALVLIGYSGLLAWHLHLLQQLPQ